MSSPRSRCPSSVPATSGGASFPVCPIPVRTLLSALAALPCTSPAPLTLIVLSSAPATRYRLSGLKHTDRTYESGPPLSSLPPNLSPRPPLPPHVRLSSATWLSSIPSLLYSPRRLPVSASYKTAVLLHPVATYLFQMPLTTHRSSPLSSSPYRPSLLKRTQHTLTNKSVSPLLHLHLPASPIRLPCLPPLTTESCSSV
eukprot:764940-Hanusia_phi.AAC.2